MKPDLGAVHGSDRRECARDASRVSAMRRQHGRHMTRRSAPNGTVAWTGPTTVCTPATPMKHRTECGRPTAPNGVVGN